MAFLSYIPLTLDENYKSGILLNLIVNLKNFLHVEVKPVNQSYIYYDAYPLYYLVF